MSWVVPKIWENGDVWILGGGPSVTKQFGIPDSIVKAVIDKKAFPNAYSPYMEGIHNKHVIGINVAYLIGDWIDMIYFGDHGFFNNHIEGLANFPGLKISSHPQIEKVPWVKFIPRDLSKRWGISKNPNQIIWNGNSGGAAISIAANTGAKRIILVGFDMKLDDTTSMRHWHDLYNNGPESATKNKLPFEKHKKGFKQIIWDARARGIEILNASPDSAITELPKVTVKELL
jgi:hypothetical protein